MAKTLNVLHLACLAPPEVGGVGMSAFREGEGLRARGHRAELIAPANTTPIWRVGNAATLPVEKILAQDAWDVVHLHYPFYGTAEWVLGWPRRVPVVMTFHMDAEMGGWREPFAVVHRALIQPWLLHQARKIIVTSLDYAASSSVAKLIQAHDPRVAELPFGVDLRVFCPGPRERARFGLPEEANVFLMVGGLDRAHAFKGTAEAIRALAKLAPTRPSVLASRGDGDLKPALQALAAELGVSDRVFFLPKCATEDLPRLYRSADALLVPSTSKAEAFGIVAIEAQACGLPVIASNLPGVRSVIVENETGWLVQPRDVLSLAEQMERVLRLSQTERQAFSARAVSRAREYYDAERHLDQLIQLYQEVCV